MSNFTIRGAAKPDLDRLIELEARTEMRADVDDHTVGLDRAGDLHGVS